MLSVEDVDDGDELVVVIANDNGDDGGSRDVVAPPKAESKTKEQSAAMQRYLVLQQSQQKELLKQNLRMQHAMMPGMVATTPASAPAKDAKTALPAKAAEADSKTAARAKLIRAALVARTMQKARKSFFHSIKSKKVLKKKPSKKEKKSKSKKNGKGKGWKIVKKTVNAKRAFKSKKKKKKFLPSSSSESSSSGELSSDSEVDLTPHKTLDAQIKAIKAKHHHRVTRKRLDTDIVLSLNDTTKEPDIITPLTPYLPLLFYIFTGALLFSGIGMIIAAVLEFTSGGPSVSYGVAVVGAVTIFCANLGLIAFYKLDIYHDHTLLLKTFNTKDKLYWAMLVYAFSCLGLLVVNFMLFCGCMYMSYYSLGFVAMFNFLVLTGSFVITARVVSLRTLVKWLLMGVSLFFTIFGFSLIFLGGYAYSAHILSKMDETAFPDWGLIGLMSVGGIVVLCAILGAVATCSKSETLLYAYSVTVGVVIIAGIVTWGGVYSTQQSLEEFIENNCSEILASVNAEYWTSKFECEKYLSMPAYDPACSSKDITHLFWEINIERDASSHVNLLGCVNESCCGILHEWVSEIMIFAQVVGFVLMICLVGALLSSMYEARELAGRKRGFRALQMHYNEKNKAVHRKKAMKYKDRQTNVKKKLAVEVEIELKKKKTSFCLNLVLFAVFTTVAVYFLPGIMTQAPENTLYERSLTGYEVTETAILGIAQGASMFAEEVSGLQVLDSPNILDSLASALYWEQVEHCFNGDETCGGSVVLETHDCLLVTVDDETFDTEFGVTVQSNSYFGAGQRLELRSDSVMDVIDALSSLEVIPQCYGEDHTQLTLDLDWYVLNGTKQVHVDAPLTVDRSYTHYMRYEGSVLDASAAVEENAFARVPLEGVTVSLAFPMSDVCTPVSTTTDVNGFYALRLPLLDVEVDSDGVSLRYSYNGLTTETQLVPLSSQLIVAVPSSDGDVVVNLQSVSLYSAAAIDGESEACGTLICAEMTECIRTANNEFCTACPPLYDGNGIIGCTYRDGCSIDNGGCDSLIQCTDITENKEGEFYDIECGECPQGFEELGLVSGTVTCVDIDECALAIDVCDPLVTCVNIEGGYRCTECPQGYVRAESVNGTDDMYLACLPINECDGRQICHNGGVCEDMGIHQVACNCSNTGWVGERCSEFEPLSLCASGPCEAGAVCSTIHNGNNQLDFHCDCTNTGRTGERCEISPCDSSPCVAAGTCVNHNKAGDNEYAFSCDCDGSGYEGDLCENPINYCAGTPCANGGVCYSNTSLPGFECDCTSTGFTGSTCEQDGVNDCASSPCMNGGICWDRVNDFVCDCSGVLDFGGSFCNITDAYCESSPCKNGGICTEDNNGGFTCDCASSEYEGTTCKSFPNLCTEGVCGNATCVTTSFDTYECDCASLGYVDDNECETIDFTDDCNLEFGSACQNGGDCTDTGLNSFVCDCVGTGYGGDTCNTDLNDCVARADECLNGGTCVDMGLRSFLCKCTSGWLGDRCEVAVDDCISDPCLNGGICTNMKKPIKNVGFNCTCASGFLGNVCQDNNFCVSQPCQNGGFCSDEGACECVPPWTGETCEFDSTSCDVNNGGCNAAVTCTAASLNGGVVCGSCPPGYGTANNKCVLSDSFGTVSIVALDALQGLPIVGLFVYVMSGKNSYDTENALQAGFINTDGVVRIDLPPGDYSLVTQSFITESTIDHYPDTRMLKSTRGFSVFGSGVEQETAVYPVPDFSSDEFTRNKATAWRVVLTWDDEWGDTDLDLGAWFETANGICDCSSYNPTCGHCHVTRDHRGGSYGADVMSFSALTNATYHVYVHMNYAAENVTLASTGATVNVYANGANAAIATYPINLHENTGFDYWNVFCIDGGFGMESFLGLNYMQKFRPTALTKCGADLLAIAPDISLVKNLTRTQARVDAEMEADLYAAIQEAMH